MNELEKILSNAPTITMSESQGKVLKKLIKFMEKTENESFFTTAHAKKLDDQFEKINRTITRKLIDDGIIRSFRGIKKIDRIQIGNNISEMDDIMKSIDQNCTFHMMIPFINEGVLVYYIMDKIIYNHFTVKNVNFTDKSIRLYMDIYQFSLSHEYFSKIADLEYTFKQIENEGDKCNFDLHVSDLKFTFDYVEKYYHDKPIMLKSKYEYELYSLYSDLKVYSIQDLLDREQNNSCNEIDEILVGFATAIVTVNNYIDLAKRASDTDDENSSKNTRKYNRSSSTKNVTPTLPTKSKNDVIIINGIKIKKGENSQIKTKQGKIINRQTQVWSVIGHVRHYKNGKVVYIQPYKKGPGRDKEGSKPNRKIYKVQTSEK